MQQNKVVIATTKEGEKTLKYTQNFRTEIAFFYMGLYIKGGMQVKDIWGQDPEAKICGQEK